MHACAMLADHITQFSDIPGSQLCRKAGPMSFVSKILIFCQLLLLQLLVSNMCICVMVLTCRKSKPK